MAPVTRARRVRANITGENIEPLSPALKSNIITPTRPSHNHVRFDRDEENTPPTTVQKADPQMQEITKETNYRRDRDINDSKSDEIPEEEEEEEAENSDNDAPEAVSMSTGKELAEKREEEARRVVEAQKEANKKKRKKRDTKLKEQKTEAKERKRERESKRSKLEVEQDEQDAIEDQLSREVMAASEETEPAPPEIISKKSKPPLLLPESLLAQVSTRFSPLPKSDAGEDTEDVGALVTVGNSAGVSVRLEKNRRRREQKKRNKDLKKGVVNVKLLKDEMASRKSMAPPASKKVAHIKESWLHKQGNGGLQRRSVGGGFIRKK